MILQNLPAKPFSRIPPGDCLWHLDNLKNEETFFFFFFSGAVQLVKCNHYRSAVYFTESINNKQCPQRAYRCATYADFANGLCSKCPSPDCPVMGYNAVNFKNILSGKFYLKTEDEKPFCCK